MRNRRKNWLLRRLVLGLAVAAIVAPTAQARLYEGGTAQSDGGNGAIPVRADDFVLVPYSGGIAVRGDDFVLAPDSGGVPVATQVRDSEPIQGGRPTGRQVPIAVTGSGTSDFNWGDGLIGAAAALGLALLAFGAARSTRGMGRPATN